MADRHIVQGFSRMSRTQKLNWLRTQTSLSQLTIETLNSNLHPDPVKQDIYNDISENTISNFILPLGLAPNFLINGDLMTLPMVSEESSVVAAASHAAKFWASHGGFHCEVKDMLKVGQVHFTWKGSRALLKQSFEEILPALSGSLNHLTRRMEQRGGGISSIDLRQTTANPGDAYQLFVQLRTADAMGANFINSVLEALALRFQSMMLERHPGQAVDLVMAILSNYTPQSLVSCRVEADTKVFDGLYPAMSGHHFAEKFTRAVWIASQDPFRAVTHNKGIFNGMDAVIMATGNDFRASEACGHAFASGSGAYRGLTTADYAGKSFSLTLEVPLSVGTVGGLTTNHPMASAAMEILGFPSSEKLMQVIASAGLASNFSAIRALITTGIQKGHMQMHLGNILRQLGANEEERSRATFHFTGKTFSHRDVSDFILSLRKPDNSL